MKFNRFIFNILIGSFLVSGLVRCTDLDEEPYTFTDPEDYYTTGDELEKALNSVYDGYQAAFGGDNYKYIMYLEVLTEFGSPAYAKDNMHLWNVWNDVNNAEDRTFNVWSKGYTAINKANLILGRGENTVMDDFLKTRYFAEARFLRALTMFNLVRIYGGLPIPESYTSCLNGLEIPRQTVDSTYNYIIADLKYAEKHLPRKSELDGDEVWRASQGAAQAFLGEVYLTRGSMEEDQDYFQLAKDYCWKVMSSGDYDLEPDFKDLWFWWNTENKNGIESVFELQYGLYSGLYNHLHVMFGVNITEKTLGCYMYRRFGPSIFHYQSYSDQDARKESTFLTTINVTNEDGDITNVLTFNTDDKGYYPGTDGWKTASPGNIKFYDRTAESASLKLPRADIYVMRYADVLLNYAEAENELNGPTTDAYDAIDDVRNRAGLPDLTSGLSKEQFADSLYRERGWELVGEGQLYFDELRTDRIGENVKKHNEQAMEEGIYMYQNLDFVPSKNFLWKIPQYDLDSNSALRQNSDNVSK
jgi:hypothetical protein